MIINQSVLDDFRASSCLYDLSYPSTPPPPPQRKLDRRQTGRLMDNLVGEGVGVEPNHTTAKILFLCKSFNTLCPRRFDALMNVSLRLEEKWGRLDRAMETNKTSPEQRTLRSRIFTVRINSSGIWYKQRHLGKHFRTSDDWIRNWINST
jgi:hypothetical protein